MRTFDSILIANRGEIAIRVARTAALMGIRTIGVYSRDDANALHRFKTDEAVEIPIEGPGGEGPAAYLNMDVLLRVAKETGAAAVHPGYGFLSENAEFAKRCQDAGLVFVGPAPEILAGCGDKAAARALAARAGLPVLPGTDAGISVEGAQKFMESLGEGGAIMLKAVGGGGGIGMRPVEDPAELVATFARCASEARSAFGDDRLYAERLFRRARHIEVQVLGDGTGNVTHLGERECSLQRQRQKIIEMAPAPGISAATRSRILNAAVGLAAELKLDNLATVEFLIDATASPDDVAEPEIAFIETNARIQVEHTVTEEVTGFDLVALQLGRAAGESLQALGLDKPPEPRGAAIQARVNVEKMMADGTPRPSGGTLAAYDPPSGPGIRVDGYGYAGYTTNPRFDSLLAKVIAYSPRDDMKAAGIKLGRALAEFGVEGVTTNLPFLRALLGLGTPLFESLHTGLVAERSSELLAAADGETNALTVGARRGREEARPSGGLAGARIDARDPLAVLSYGKEEHTADASVAGALSSSTFDSVSADSSIAVDGPPGTSAVLAPMQGTVVSLELSEGSLVRVGDPMLVMEAMKMEHVIAAEMSGVVRELSVSVGDTVFEGHPIIFIEPSEVAGDQVISDEVVDPDEVRPDLAELIARQAKTLDKNRPRAVARRRKTGQRTTRENIDALVDADSFSEYGGLTIAARRRDNSIEKLIDETPTDGLVCGVAQVNGDRFPEERSRAMVIAYDYTVLAGTQGKANHDKKDRMFELAERLRLPVVLLAEGGGGRSGDSDTLTGASLQLPSFHRFAKLSGLVPLVGVTSGRCFAGNAVLLGCCDVIIATANSSIGMAGPAMIEGGGLGVYKPGEVGPMSVQVPNGVVDIAVADEEEAIQVARKYLSYFQGATEEWSCSDQRELRRLVPENRLRVYDVRKVIDVLADNDSVLEIRRGYGPGMVTAFIRIEGRPVGVLANNPAHLGGAIDSDASDKAARFMQLCDAFDIPILSLCDTPGNMVGPEYERTALVRHCCRVFLVGANITVPLITLVLRKGYGLGALGMAGGGFHAPVATLSWPTGEFGGMGLEGAVKLGFRDQLQAIEDPEERLAYYEDRVAELYEKGKAISIASFFELDDVIDPEDTRCRVMSILRSLPPVRVREGKKRSNVDSW